MLTGRTITIDTKPDATVSKVLYEVWDKEGLPANDIRLIFGGKQLEPGRTLAEYGVQKGSTLHLVLRLSGGVEFYVAKRGSTVFSGFSQELIKVNPR